MILFYIMSFFFTFTAIAGDHQNILAVIIAPHRNVEPESHALRLLFCERTKNLLDRQIITPELHSHITGEIMTQPIEVLDPLMNYIHQLHKNLTNE